MIWFGLDKCASPSTEMPLTVLQLDKSEVYLMNPNGKSQTHQVCSVLEVVGKSQDTFLKSSRGRNVYFNSTQLSLYITSHLSNFNFSTRNFIFTVQFAGIIQHKASGETPDRSKTEVPHKKQEQIWNLSVLQNS